MSKAIVVLILTIIGCTTVNSEIIWGKFHNVNTSYCPNPDNLKDKYPKLEQTSLPVNFINGPYKYFCVKEGCNSYEPSTYTVKTPYVQALTGFRVEMDWEWTKPNYTSNETKLNSNWCVYYNQNNCYLGGAEFGFCHYSRGYISFYAGCGYANMKNISDDLKDQIKTRWPLKPSSTEINHINMTVIANNTGYFKIENFFLITRNELLRVTKHLISCEYHA